MKRAFIVLCKTIPLVPLFSFLLPAQLSETKLIPADGSAENLFGNAVGISQTLAIVGAPYDDDGGENTGSAYVYRWDGVQWIETAKLTGSAAATQDMFGSAVDIDGDRAVVGAPGVGPDRGTAYVFRRDGLVWTEEAVLMPADAGPGDFFGSSVAIDGELILVGSFGDSSASGSAYLFRLVGTTWIELDKLTASDATASDYFGVSVSLSGNYALIGTWLDDDNGVSSGSAYLFRGTGSDWTEEAKFTPQDGDGDDYFGFTTAISGDFAVIGAYGDEERADRAGAAYIFRKNGNVWTEMTKLVASDAETNDFFGYAVDIADTYVTISAPWDDDAGGSSGSVYLFQLEGAEWRERTKVVAQDGNESDNFGKDVAVSPQFFIAGSPQDDDDGSNSGSAYVYSGFGPLPTVSPIRTSSESSELHQNHPNPFNNTTTIMVRIDRRERVVLKVFDSLGREVATLVDGLLEPGDHRIAWNTNQSASGVYLCRLQSGELVRTRKMVLVK